MLTLDRAAQTAQSYIHRVLEDVENGIQARRNSSKP